MSAYWSDHPQIALMLVGGGLTFIASLLHSAHTLSALLTPATSLPLQSVLVCLTASLFSFCTISVDGAQLPAPMGLRLRGVALPLLRSFPLLSLTFARALFLLLALAILASDSEPAAIFIQLLQFIALALAVIVIASTRNVPAALLHVEVIHAIHALGHDEDGQAKPSSRVSTDIVATLSRETFAALVPLRGLELADALVSLDLNRDGQVSESDLICWEGLSDRASFVDP